MRAGPSCGVAVVKNCLTMEVKCYILLRCEVRTTGRRDLLLRSIYHSTLRIIQVSNGKEKEMEELRERITRWASHGTLEQLKMELDGYLKREGYDSEMQGDELVVFKPRKEGGFLGIGAKTIKTPLMKISRAGGAAKVLQEPFDEDLAQIISVSLRQH